MSLAQVLVHQANSPELTPIVFVVDENISDRVSLEMLIRSQGWQAETFASLREFLARPRPVLPNCLVLALPHGDKPGLEVLRQIAKERLEMPIIVVSGYEDIPTAVQAMKAGAADFLVKPCGRDALIGGMRQGLERSRVALDREMQLRDLQRCYASLTPRERQVMTLVVSGLLNKQVGGELGISEFTVKAHRGHLMQKMKANSLADLVRMAAKLRTPHQAMHLA